ncbi:ArnT family glycosyltransferase [Pseudoalteromonas galatheae]|uniref:ArnT family glycosyltransferase n=1 Tax=Pseudoalteromonas galatheae TaxID=579562 RepID=UPI0030D1031A
MRHNYTLFCVVLGLMLLRLFTLGSYPLFDTTEARYAEIARLMIVTQDWITPWFDKGVPFWGKPPAHTWITALSFEAFGISPWSARFAHWCTGALSLIILYFFAKRSLGVRIAQASILILASCIGFFIATGMVMTDPALMLSSTLAMASFWLCYKHNNRAAGVIFFFSCGLGMLIKGPVAVVIVGIAIVLWAIWQKRLYSVIKALPWSLGLPVFVVTFLPWYMLAESKTPGFLNYFLIGEHIQRFLQPGWQGDLYGTAHVEPKGTIWLMWLIVACPWSVLFFIRFFKSPDTRAVLFSSEIKTYLMTWTIAPLLLFTFASNILSAYVLPGLPAFALLVALYFEPFKGYIKIGLISFCFYALLIAALIFGWHSKDSEHTTLSAISKPCPNTPVYYLKKLPFSGRFYSCGWAELVMDDNELFQLIQTQKTSYVVLTHEQRSTFLWPKNLQCDVLSENRQRILHRCVREHH